MVDQTPQQQTRRLESSTGYGQLGNTPIRATRFLEQVPAALHEDLRYLARTWMADDATAKEVVQRLQGRLAETLRYHDHDQARRHDLQQVLAALGAHRRLAIQFFHDAAPAVALDEEAA